MSNKRWNGHHCRSTEWFGPRRLNALLETKCGTHTLYLCQSLRNSMSSRSSLYLYVHDQKMSEMSVCELDKSLDWVSAVLARPIIRTTR